MLHQTLYDIYLTRLAYIERRMQDDVLEFYGEEKRDWKHAKEIAFQMYEALRYEGEDPGYPTSVVKPDEPIPPYKIGDTEFPCIGVLKYRGEDIPVYNDDYGMRDFIVYQGREITHDSFGLSADWYYEVDRIKDKIDC